MSASTEQLQALITKHSKELGVCAGAIAALLCAWLAYRATSGRGKDSQGGAGKGTRAIAGSPDGAARGRSNSALAHEAADPPVPVRYAETTNDDRQASINKRMPDSVRKSLSHPRD